MAFKTIIIVQRTNQKLETQSMDKLENKSMSLTRQRCWLEHDMSREVAIYF